MSDDKADRRAEIEAAAYGVLVVRGYDGMSMLAVAKAANASNETLYRWYGDKLGLLRAMVARNTGEVEAALDAALGRGGGLAEALEAVGLALLGMLLGDRAVALNRAAAADASGVLGHAIAMGGRGVVLPRIAALMAEHGGAEVFLSLLVGDWQIRRVIGVMALPSDAERRARVAMAVQGVLALGPAGLVNDRLR